MVDARDVKKYAGSRIASPSEALAEEQAVRLFGADAGALTPPPVDRLMDHLRELAQLATDAVDQLAAVQSS